jgi:hypothetical protein
VPRTVPGIAAVTELTAGANHTCALIGDTMYCWGENGSGQLSDRTGGDATTPQLAFGFGAIQHIFGGDNNTCAIVGGKPICVGSFSNPAAQFNGFASALSIGTGRNHGCVVLADHSVHCTAGDNYDATLGDGTVMCCTDSTPVMSGASDVVIRNDQTCVLGTDHSVKCWGYNSGVRLGTGDGSYLIKAPEAQTGVMASQITLGDNIGCVLRTDMTVACWGQGFFGGVGDATYNDRNMPVAVSNLVATQVASGADHACAVMSDGTVQCWGNDNDGELGDGVILSPDPSGVRMTCP